MNLQTLVANIGVFLQFRQNNTDDCARFFQRMQAQTPLQPLDIADKTTAQIETAPAAPSALGQRLRQGWQSVSRLPCYLRQLHTMRHLTQSKQLFVLSAASSRLVLSTQTQPLSPRDSFKHWVDPQQQGWDPRLLAQLQDRSVPILLLDPARFSGYWSQHQALQRDQVYIVDGGLLLVTWVTRLFCRLPGQRLTTWRLSWQLAQQLYAQQRYSRKQVWGYAVLAAALAQHLLGNRPLSALLLTSNSALTEMMRFIVLLQPATWRMTEVLHGIMAQRMEQYLAQVLLNSHCPAQDKRHLFVPQVPYLPELPQLTQGYFYAPEVFVNSQINTRLAQYQRQSASVLALVQQRLADLLPQAADTDIVVTLFGGVSTAGFDRHYFRTPAFAIERLLLESVIAWSQQQSTRVHVLYAVHPASKPYLIDALSSIQALGVQVIDDSTLGYLITDCCLSLFSSCLFEMQWLGAQCFTPMLPEDGIYAPAYLQRLHCPLQNSSEALHNALHRCLQASQAHTAADGRSRLQRAQQRLQILGRSE